MKVYFLSSHPCALSLNGIYYGITNRFERFADIVLSDNIFVTFTPENALPLQFFLTENTPLQPPTGCEIYLLSDSLLIYAQHFTPNDTTLRVFAQKRLDNCLVTVYAQGETQLSIQTPEGYFIAYLPPAFSVCELSMHSGLIFVASPTTLCIATKRGEILFCEQILSFAVTDDEAQLRLPLNDSGNRYADCRYALSETQISRLQFSISDACVKTADDLLAYAFFESVLIGANYAEMLSDELRIHAEDVRSFLGDFVRVAPTDDMDVCILVRKKAERIYTCDYYRIERKDGKIADIRKEVTK